MIYQDDGAGIPASILNRVFDAFFTTKRGSGSTGPGLHILHNLVTQKPGGTIKCESKEDLGTKFLIVWKPLKGDVNSRTTMEPEPDIDEQEVMQTGGAVPD